MKKIVYTCLKRNGGLLVIISGIVILLFASCGKAIYQYNNVNYDSAETAMEAQKNDLDLILRKITATKTPVGGSLIAILPSNAYIEKNFIT